MAWTDSIQEAAYTGPSGKKIYFSYSEELSRSTEVKTAVNTFPGVDGAQVQSLGKGATKFPMVALFFGGDCMDEADEFEALVGERGYGVLEHPIYGKHNVVPSGTIERSDNLVTGLNEARVKITFVETIVDTAFPEGIVSAEDSLDAAFEAYEDAQVGEFGDTIVTDSVDDKIDLQATLKKQSASLFVGLDDVAGQVSDLEDKQKLLQTLKGWKASVTGWLESIEDLADNATDIARTIIKASRLPAQMAVSAMAKLEGYSTIVSGLISNIKKDPIGLAAIKNQWAATSTALGGLISAMSWGTAKAAIASGSTTSSGGFMSRADVISACDVILEELEVYKDYMDSQTEGNTFVDTGNGYDQLLTTVVMAVRVLQEASLNLPMTKIVVLDRDRQVLELLTEFYGADGFNRLDEFIVDNALNADEIVLIPMGRKVRYYE